MADYAPADSLVYVEFNNLEGVAQAIQNSDVWQAAAADHSKQTGISESIDDALLRAPELDHFRQCFSHVRRWRSS